MKTYPHENEAELAAAGIDRIPRPPQSSIECRVCGKASDSIEAVITDEWAPSYYEDGEEMEGPVCPACCQAYLRVGADGELESFDRWEAVK